MQRDRAAPPATTEKHQEKQTLKSFPWQNKQMDSPCTHPSEDHLGSRQPEATEKPFCPDTLQAAVPRSLDSPATCWRCSLQNERSLYLMPVPIFQGHKMALDVPSPTPELVDSVPGPHSPATSLAETHA